MGAKKIVYGEEAREKLLEGIDTVANAVKVTPVSYTHLTLPTTPYV